METVERRECKAPITDSLPWRVNTQLCKLREAHPLTHTLPYSHAYYILEAGLTSTAQELNPKSGIC